MMHLIQLLTDQRAYEGLLTPGGEHHGIGDGDGLVMTKNEDPPLSRAPNGLQIYPPEEEQGLAAAPSRGSR